jgi:hypothetical protein
MYRMTLLFILSFPRFGRNSEGVHSDVDSDERQLHHSSISRHAASGLIPHSGSSHSMFTGMKSAGGRFYCGVEKKMGFNDGLNRLPLQEVKEKHTCGSERIPERIVRRAGER